MTQRTINEVPRLKLGRSDAPRIGIRPSAGGCSMCVRPCKNVSNEQLTTPQLFHSARDEMNDSTRAPYCNCIDEQIKDFGCG
jgi:hypothetical protein